MTDGGDNLRMKENYIYLCPPQQFLNFLPLPHGHGSFLPTFWVISGFSGFGADIISKTSEKAFEQNSTVADE